MIGRDELFDFDGATLEPFAVLLVVVVGQGRRGVVDRLQVAHRHVKDVSLFQLAELRYLKSIETVVKNS